MLLCDGIPGVFPDSKQLLKVVNIDNCQKENILDLKGYKKEELQYSVFLYLFDAVIIVIKHL